MSDLEKLVEAVGKLDGDLTELEHFILTKEVRDHVDALVRSLEEVKQHDHEAAS
jgi:hypothetical protein